MGNHKITYEMLHPSIVEDINKNTTGDLSGLETPVKDSIVGAINCLNAEYMQSGPAKEKIANAIGEPLDKNNSIDEMVANIEDLITDFKNKLLVKGVSIDTEDKFDKLIEKIQFISNDSGASGVQMVTDTTSLTKTSAGYGCPSATLHTNSIRIPVDIGFEPTMIFGKLYAVTSNGPIGNTVISHEQVFISTGNDIVIQGDGTGEMGRISVTYENNEIVLTINATNYGTYTINILNGNFIWYAVGTESVKETKHFKLNATVDKNALAIPLVYDLDFTPSTLLVKVSLYAYDASTVTIKDVWVSNLYRSYVHVINKSSGEMYIKDVTDKGCTVIIEHSSTSYSLCFYTGAYTHNYNVEVIAIP